MSLKKCRVCGAEYEACRSANRINSMGLFYWKEVACCPQHGSIYLARIMKSREDSSVTDDAAAEPVLEIAADFDAEVEPAEADESTADEAKVDEADEE
jgi:hypothetical protein